MSIFLLLFKREENNSHREFRESQRPGQLLMEAEIKGRTVHRVQWGQLTETVDMEVAISTGFCVMVSEETRADPFKPTNQCVGYSLSRMTGRHSIQGKGSEDPGWADQGGDWGMLPQPRCPPAA